MSKCARIEEFLREFAEVDENRSKIVSFEMAAIFARFLMAGTALASAGRIDLV